MEKVYPDGLNPVNPPIFGVPLEVAQDHELTDGAILLFGEIFGLVRAYGICTALDPHFMGRRGKSRSTIQSQIKELRLRGHMYVVTDKHSRREIRVPQRYLGGKDGAENFTGNRKEADPSCTGNEKEADDFPENREETPAACPENGKEGGYFPENGPGVCPENETHKNPESEEERDSKNQTPSLKTPESLSWSFRKSISDEDRKKAQTTWEMFKAHPENGSVREYEGLLLKCTEVGREECFDLGVLQARISQDEGELQTPVAYIRHIITTHLKNDDKNETLALQIIAGTAKGMAGEKANPANPPQSLSEAEREAIFEAARRMKSMSPFEANMVMHIAQGLAQQADHATMGLMFANPARQALVRNHLPAALMQWDQEQASKPKKPSLDEMRAKDKAARAKLGA